MKKEQPGCLKTEFKPLFQKDEYCRMVENAKEYIYQGDIFQVVLSNRLEAEYEGSLLNTYRIMRTTNPSPYMFYFSGTDVEVAGASRETLVKLENGVLHTFPLAGTRPRGKTAEEEIALEKELLADKKNVTLEALQSGFDYKSFRSHNMIYWQTPFASIWTWILCTAFYGKQKFNLC